jgi:hypothetical protein
MERRGRKVAEKGTAAAGTLGKETTDDDENDHNTGV